MLTPEERKRIYEEEKVRVEANAKIVADKQAQATKKGCMGCLVLVGVIFGVSVVVSLFSSGSSEKKAEQDVQSRQITAYTMAKEFITKRLKSPGSAEFPSIVWNASEVHVVPLSTGGYRVSAWVDAQNAFGAKLRKIWVCELKETSTDTWSVTGECGLLE